METGGRPTVAVIGAGGLVARAALPHLRTRYDLRLLDRRADRASGVSRVDARKVRGLARRLRGCDAVLDLAADARWDTPWKAVYRNNIPLAVAVLEASRIAGVARVVQASSNQVAAGYEGDEPAASVLAGDRSRLSPSDVPRMSTLDVSRPVNAYGAAKVFGEAACRWYAEAYGLTTVCLRIGTVLEPDRPRNSRHFATWLSHRDLQGFVEAAIEAPLSASFTPVWAVSDNTWAIWDVAESARRLGYQPVDDAESWRSAQEDS